MEERTANNQALPPVPAVTGKSHDPFKVWMMILALLFVLAASFATWQTIQLNNQSARLTELENNNSALQTTNSTLQNELDELKGTDSTTEGSDSTNPETVKILAAVDAYVRAPETAEGGAFEYGVAKNEGGYARVTVSPSEGSGYTAWLKKVGDNWTVVVAGQDNPTQEIVDKYAIPSALML